MKQKKKIKAFSTLILAGILCCSASILVYATNTRVGTTDALMDLPMELSANTTGTTPPPASSEETPPEDPPEPPIEPDDFESPDEPDLPVYPVEPVTPAEPEPQPEPAPQPEPEPEPQPEPEPEPQPEPEPAPQPEPAPTLPQTSQLWWPVGLVFILGFAMVLAGLVEMRKSRRHEDSDR